VSLEGARRVAAHATVGFAFGAAAIGGALPGAAVGLFAVAFAASLAWPGRLGRAGAGAATGATGLSFAVLAFAWLAGLLDLVPAATSFAVALAANRLVARKRAADDGLLYLSALLMLAGGAALTADLAYGLFFAGFSLSATSALTLSHLSRSVEEAQATRRQAAALASRRLFAGVFALSALGLAGALAVFFAFPRFTAGVWARSRGQGGAAATGFSSAIRLGGAGPLKSDARVLLHVAVAPDPGRERLDLLWKGKSLDRYDGRAFVSTARRASAQARRRFEVGPDQSGASTLEVEVRPAAQTSAAFAPQGAFLLADPRRVPPAPFSAGLAFLHLTRDSAGDFEVEPSPGGAFAYSARAALGARPELSGRGASYPDAIREQYLQLPPLDPRIPELAARWTEGFSDPYDKARAIERALGAFAYSAELPGEEAADPLASFLFERRAGHCELFSTAMTVLLRASGVPARAATGFYGGERAGEGTYILRAGDAHAWSEVYFPGVGFAPFDPTPPAGRRASQSRTSAFFADLYDQAEALWLSTVVDFGYREQARAVKGALRLLSSGLERFQDRGGDGAARPLQVVGAAAALALAGLAARLLWKRSRGRTRRRRPEDPAAKVYRALLRRLARRGIEKAPGQTPRELAARLLAEGRAEAREVGALTERYLAARFGARRLGRAELRELWRRVRAL
jgi:transglutaminase-like putative cysteine protease